MELSSELDRLQKYKAIEKELQRAKKIHPNYPTDIFIQLAIMQEEAGEATKAVLDYQCNKCSIDSIIQELIQTAAMCMRMLEAIQPQKQSFQIKADEYICTLGFLKNYCPHALHNKIDCLKCYWSEKCENMDTIDVEDTLKNNNKNTYLSEAEKLIEKGIPAYYKTRLQTIMYFAALKGEKIYQTQKKVTELLLPNMVRVSNHHFRYAGYSNEGVIYKKI